MGSTPIYGFPYPDPSDLVANYPALGQDLAEDVETVINALPPGGLRHINTTTFTSVSAVNVNNVFTSTYANYRIVINGLTISTSDQDLLLRVRAAGSDAASNYSFGYGRVTDTSLAHIAGNSNTSFTLIGRMTVSTYNNNTVIFDVTSPALATFTQFQSASNLSLNQYFGFGTHMGSAAYDGFSLLPGANLISGTVRTYGYQNS
jgi:hypothetical protein